MKIHCTRFPCLPLDTTLWEKVSLSTVKVLDAGYLCLSTHTHTHATVSQLVSLSRVGLFPVIGFLHYVLRPLILCHILRSKAGFHG